MQPSPSFFFQFNQEHTTPLERNTQVTALPAEATFSPCTNLTTSPVYIQIRPFLPISARSYQNSTQPHQKIMDTAKHREPFEGVPKECENQCGFFGDPKTGNLCSKCFAAKCRPISEDESNERPSKKLKLMEKPEIVPTESKTTTTPTEEETKLLKENSPSQSNIPSTTQVLSPLKNDTESHCHSCSKKIGLTAIKCRCGFKFCPKHRYADQHACSFDYKTHGRNELEAKNPKIVATKVQSI